MQLLSFMDTPSFERAHRGIVCWGSAAIVGGLASLFSGHAPPSFGPVLVQVGNRLCLSQVETVLPDSSEPAGCLPETGPRSR